MASTRGSFWVFMNVKPNNVFERAVGHCGPRLAAVRSTWPVAQAGR